MRNLGARGKGGMTEGKRHQLMQNLFGDQSEEEEEEEEIESEQQVNRHPEYPSDEGEGEAEFDGEGEGEAQVEGQGETEVENEWYLQDIDHDGGESERERVKISPKRDMSDQIMETGGKDEEDSDEQDDYGQRVVTSRRREVIASISERSDENHYAEYEDEEVDQAKRPSNSLNEEEDKDPLNVLHSTAEIQDVFGNSDEDEQDDYMAQNYHDQNSHRSLMEEEESFEKDPKPEDMVPSEDAQYASEEDKIDQIQKEKPVGPPLELEIPLRPPPGLPDKMNMIKVSNIMGIDPKPFDPQTYVEEEVFVKDESGANKRIRLEDNIVRWRCVRNHDGPISYESNARFVRWSDSSLQLLIGNEVLDISVQGAQHDQTHLFLRHGKGILQSQGRLLRKMRFMPSSLSSKSHRRLTALVDSRHKKVYKVKNCITDIDPEKDKEEKEKALGQSIRASDCLHRKQVKVKRKYALPVERGCQLSPGFLEDALEEDDEREDPYESRHSAGRRHLEEDFEVQAEGRILNAKKSRVMEDVRRKPSVTASHPSQRPVEYSENEREESEYESTGDEGEQSPVGKRPDEPELEEEEEEEVEETAANGASGDKDDEVPGRRNKASGRVLKRKEPESDPASTPRKSATRRCMAVVYDSDED